MPRATSRESRMTTPSSRSGQLWVGWLFCLVVANGCSSNDHPTAPSADANGEIELRVTEELRGGRVLVSVHQNPARPERRLAAIQAWLWFDPSRLRYLGQFETEGAYLVVNAEDAGKGALRFAGLKVRGLPDDAAVFAFDRLRPGNAGIAFQAEAAAGVGGVRLPLGVGRWSPRPGAITVAGTPKRITLAEWQGKLSSPTPHRPGVLLVPGEGRVYGDADLSGQININDALGVALVSVMSEPLLTNLATDYAVAGNVDPANLPGLGESS